jgi:hypothetical protein
MTQMNTQVLLASRPQGEPTTANFRIVSTPVPALEDGQVLVRHHYLSLDPYMRMRMNDGKSYARRRPLDTVMIGGTVGEVVESRHPALPRATRSWAWAAGSSTRWSTPPRPACCARWTPRTCRCRPTWARWACPVSRPGWA